MYSEKWVKSIFHVTFRIKSQLLYRQQTYNNHQEFLYSLCRELKDKGYGYRRISSILNKRGYKSVRNTVFTNGHIQSILNKGLVRKNRIEGLLSDTDYDYEILDTKLKFQDLEIE